MKTWVRGTSLLGAAVVVSLAAPLAAQAATKTVQVGPFGAQAKTLEAVSGDANAFFRHTVTLHAGDRVSWRFNGFHTVTFVPRGQDRPALFAPDPTNKVAGVNDAGGAPF